MKIKIWMSKRLGSFYFLPNANVHQEFEFGPFLLQIIEQLDLKFQLVYKFPGFCFSMFQIIKYILM